MTRRNFKFVSINRKMMSSAQLVNRNELEICLEAFCLLVTLKFSEGYLSLVKSLN